MREATAHRDGGGGAKSCKNNESGRRGGHRRCRSSGPSRLAATAEASTRMPSGDVEAGAVFESGSYCRIGLKGGISAGGHGAWRGEVAGI
jgi:hypothetical protein